MRIRLGIRAFSVLFTCAALAVPAVALNGLAGASTDFTTFSAPMTTATDFATGFPVAFGLGPIGVLHDGTNFFATDPYGDGNLYKFPATGGSVATATTAPLGFFGLALSHGVYYGTTGSALQSFDPATLALGPVNVTLPDSGNWAVVGDPTTTDIYVSSFFGIFRIQNPSSAAPTITQFATGKFDGLAFTNDGAHLWVADTGMSNVDEFGRDGTLQAIIVNPLGPDGIAIATHGAVEGGINVSDNVFVNDNNGSIMRIDTNNSNASSIVVTGGTRGDFGTVGPDGCFYATQTDRVEKLAPCFFQPTSGPPPNSGPPPGSFLDHGTFVIGSSVASVGTKVTYWGSQWRQRNTSISGAPSAFKGFTDNTAAAPPTCGSTWTSRPGNSSKPPSKVPSQMAVVVSSHVHQSGSVISGTVEHIVVVTTNSGYAADPGHAGTGTVTSVIC